MSEQLWALAQDNTWHALLPDSMHSLCNVRVDVDRKYIVGSPDHYLIGGQALHKCRSCLEKLGVPR